MNTSVDTSPRILLLEDDPVSAAFLTAAIEALPAQVALAGTLSAARALACAQRYDLWLFDAHLPDGSGAELLAELRGRGLPTRALAHTADARRDALDALIDAGFEEVLHKPLSVAQLHGAVRRFCSGTSTVDTDEDLRNATTPGCGKLPVWDDDAALRALNGQRSHVDSLRMLFAQELPQTAARISAARARGDNHALRAELHKLQAGCGFVGAARLGDAARALHATPDRARTIVQFEGALQDTLSSFPD
jgi:DNA-binding response OmpR family regulator